LKSSLFVIEITDVEFMVSQPFFADTRFFLCLLGEEAGGVIGD
jgi:hypothetical protein